MNPPAIRLKLLTCMSTMLLFSNVALTATQKPVSNPVAEAPVETSAEVQAPAPAAAKASIILLSRAVGEVGERVVTSREVRIDDAVEQAVSNKPASPDGFRVLNGQEKAFPGEVSKVLDEWIVFLEAKTLSSQSISKTEISSTVKTVQDFWGAKSIWQELEVGSDELRDTVERKLVAKNFERLKSDPNLAPVSDDEALAYYRKNRLRFGSLPFSSFKDNIKAFLVKSQTERRLAEWRDVLRRKYKVRNFIAG
jgi:hypothetical protein